MKKRQERRQSVKPRFISKKQEGTAWLLERKRSLKRINRAMTVLFLGKDDEKYVHFFVNMIQYGPEAE